MPQGKPEHVPDDGLTTRQRRRQPVLAVHTGAGKGKSTAAFGMALRAWSVGWPIAVFQFVKSQKWKVGEEAALKALGEHGGKAAVTWHKMGDGWSWIARPGTQHVVITGRYAPQALLDAADLVTEMTKVKHPMDAGQKGQKGIEW